ncbi:MAG TPA: hypothetical protein VF122_02980, partial [Caulobacteraceae bacterium]
ACNAPQPAPQPAPEPAQPAASTEILPPAPEPPPAPPAPGPTTPGAAVAVARAYFDTREIDPRYRSYAVQLGEPGPMEGAAGSIYIEIPVQVTGTLTTGEVEHLAGSVTLRRVNDVPGSTEEQRRWHVASVDLSPQ